MTMEAKLQTVLGVAEEISENLVAGVNDGPVNEPGRGLLR